MRTPFFTRVFAVLLAFSLAVPVWGFVFITNSSTQLPIKWPAGNITLVVALGTTPTLSDGLNYNSSFQAAVQSWNTLLGALQMQVVTQATSYTPGDGNDLNEVVFASSVYGSAFDSNTLAVTTTWRIGNERIEGDIVFNSAQPWSSYRGSLRSSMDIQRVAIHELGHLLGLDHPDEDNQTVSAVMNSHISNVDTQTADDTDGARRLYGPPGVPVNDNFAAATVLTFVDSTTLQVLGYNTNASRQTGEPLHAANSGGRSVWWKWTAPATGSTSITTQGSVFDTTLGVYTGSSVSSLTTIVSNDDFSLGTIQYSSVTFNAVSGTTYYIAIDGFRGTTDPDAESGGITLKLAQESAPIITTQPLSQSVNIGQPASFSVTALGNNMTYQWKKDSSPISGATSSTYQIPSVSAASAGSYSVTITNLIGNVTSSSATLVALTPIANQAVSTGHSISFSAGSSGANYQWQLSTNSGASWSNLADNTTYSGATTGTLTIANAGSTLNGAQYRYVATVGSSVTTSSAFTLTVAAALVPNPSGLVSDIAGNLTVTDSSTNVVQKITTAGAVSTLAGTANQAAATDGLGALARFNQPMGLARDATTGTLYVADSANATIRKILTDGTTTTFAGSSSTRGNTDGASATFSLPIGLALDSSGNLYVADATNHTIRKITSTGTTSTLAGSPGVSGSADGTGSAARFNHPSGLTVDGSGNVYVTDTYNHTIRKITTPGGVVTTIAGLQGVSSAVVTSTGLFAVNSGGGGDLNIRDIILSPSASALPDTVAVAEDPRGIDGTGANARFNLPTGIVFDGSGALYIADTGASSIRKLVLSTSAVTTLAGLSSISGMKDGTSYEAWFNQPQALYLDSLGNLYVADTGNASVRKVVVSTGAVSTLSLSVASTGTGGGGTSGGGGASSGGGGGGGGALNLSFALCVLGLVTLRWVGKRSVA